MVHNRKVCPLVYAGVRAFTGTFRPAKTAKLLNNFLGWGVVHPDSIEELWPSNCYSDLSYTMYISYGANDVDIVVEFDWCIPYVLLLLNP